jgi:hypothetical protein
MCVGVGVGVIFDICLDCLAASSMWKNELEGEDL